MRYCCLIAACDPKWNGKGECKACGGNRKYRRKPYVRPPWEKVTVTGIEGGRALVDKPSILPVDKARGARNAMPDEEFAMAYPSITEYLTTSQWSDGSHRKTSSLSIFVEQGVVKLSLYDKELERTLFVSAETLVACFRLMEATLMTTAVPWVSWKKGKR